MSSYPEGQSARRRSSEGDALLVHREAPDPGRCRKIEMVKESLAPGALLPSKITAKFLSALAISFVVATALAYSASAQTFSRAFPAPPGTSELEVVNQTGTIKVTSGANTARILISARYNENAEKIEDANNAQGRGKVHVTGDGEDTFRIYDT